MGQKRKVNAKEKQFERLYYTPKLPASFGGLAAFTRTLPRKLRNDATDWLREQDTYNLHRPVRRKFRRGKIITGGLDKQFQVDLIDVSQYASHNDGTRYILSVIDCFSKYAWAKPLKRKDGSSVTSAFRDIFTENRIPDYLQSDRGKEFLNSKVQDLFKDYNIKFFTSHNDDIKCAIVERFNRTLMNKIHRYFTRNNTRSFLGDLQNILTSYNNTRHSATGLAPSNVSLKNQEKVWLKLYNKPVRYKKAELGFGDYVRISKARHIFAKGYIGRWSEELFVVVKINNTLPVTYQLKDLRGEAITGVFYSEELVRAKPPEFWRVESVLDQRNRKGKQEYLVKWSGYSKQFNSWISADNIKNI